MSLRLTIFFCLPGGCLLLPKGPRFGYYSPSPQSPQVGLTVQVRPESESALKQIAGLRQVLRHITVYTILTQEEIPEEGG